MNDCHILGLFFVTLAKQSVQFTYGQNPQTNRDEKMKTFTIFNTETGDTIATGLSERVAMIASIKIGVGFIPERKNVFVISHTQKETRK